MGKIDRKNLFGGFTLIELLVVISIVGLLLGILVPGMKVVKRQARNLRQKAAMRDIEVGLEYFRNDHGSFPESKMRPGASGIVSGAQHLAEALVGRDKYGFEPSSRWYAPTDPDPDNDLYDWSKPASQNRRDEVYIEMKDIRAATLDELYDDTIGCYSGSWGNKPAPVLLDIFQTDKTIDVDGKTVRAGSPIVYYKASRRSKYFTEVPPASPEIPKSQWIYNYLDNDAIMQLGKVGADPAGSEPHNFASNLADGVDDFYDFITNPEQVTKAGGTKYYKPFNATEYIIISAGWDGIFGTKDDLTNFNY